MAVIALTCAKGSPGVSTTALAMAVLWPRPVLLVEADVTGSSSILAGYLRGLSRHDRGLVDLAMAHRRGTLADSLHHASLELPGTSARFVPGLTSPAQASSMHQVWDALGFVLHGLESTGTDVIVDAGRLGAAGGPTSLVREADLALLLTRTHLPAVAATRARAAVMREDFTGSEPTAHDLAISNLRLLLVGEGQPYKASEVQAAVNVPVTASIAWDPVQAEVFSLGADNRHRDSSKHVRSIRAAISAIHHTIDARRGALAPTGRDGQTGALS